MDEAQGALVRQLNKLEPLLKELSKEMSGQSAVGNAQISINAGGFGIWLAVTCCVATLVGLLVASVFVAMSIGDLRQNDLEQRQVDRELREADLLFQAYINAGMVPQKESVDE